MEKVRHWWEDYRFRGKASYVLAQKLRALKAYLIKWIREELDDIRLKKKSILDDIMKLDVKEVLRALDEEERTTKFNLKKEFKSAALMEEISWRQKS